MINTWNYFEGQVHEFRERLSDLRTTREQVHDMHRGLFHLAMRFDGEENEKAIDVVWFLANEITLRDSYGQFERLARLTDAAAPW